MVDEEVKKESPQEQEQDVFKTFDAADEEQIEAELKGAVAEEMVYSFGVGGKEIKGLSKAGTWGVMRAFNKTQVANKRPFIVLSPVKEGILTESADSYGFVANASLVDMENKVFENAGGGAEASKVVRNGIKDGFALAKAITKAQRNAIRGLLPDKLVKQYIEKRSKQQKVKMFFSKGSNVSVDVSQPMNCEDCGKPLTDKSKEYYLKNPTKSRLCFLCGQKNRKPVL